MALALAVFIAGVFVMLTLRPPPIAYSAAMYAPLIAPSIPCSGETNLAQTKPSMIPANAAAIWPTVKSQKRSFDSRWAGAVFTVCCPP